MSFELSADHETFRKVVRDFAEGEIAPHVAQWDRDHHLPLEVVAKMGELGMFGLVVPEEYGGSDADFTSLCVAIEELGRVDQSIGITLEAGVGLGLDILRDRLMLARMHAVAAEQVDGAPFGRGHQPGAGPIGHAAAGPFGKRGDQGILGELLGQRDVTDHPGEPGDQPRLLDPEDRFDGAIGVGFGRHGPG